MNKNIIIGVSSSIHEAMQIFAGRTNSVIAGLSIGKSGDIQKLNAEIITDEAMKADRPTTTKIGRKKNDVIIGGIYQMGNAIFITGDKKLADYVGQRTELDMLVEGFQILKDSKTGERADSLLLWGPSDVTITHVRGRWVVIEDEKNGYGYHVFGVNPNTQEVYAFRSVRGRKNAIVAATVKNGKLNWRVLCEEPGDKRFNGVSKIIMGKDDTFFAQVTTEDGLTIPMTIGRDDKVVFGRPIKWDGQILAPWFDQGAEKGAMPTGLFTGDGDKLTFTPTSKVTDKAVLDYMKAAS